MCSLIYVAQIVTCLSVVAACILDDIPYQTLKWLATGTRESMPSSRP